MVESSHVSDSKSGNNKGNYMLLPEIINPQNVPSDRLNAFLTTLTMFNCQEAERFFVQCTKMIKKASLKKIPCNVPLET